MTAPEVGSVIGGMRIDSVAGRGAMGVVYRAHELLLDRTVALKIVNPELVGGEFRERFRREARLAAALDHPHVVPVFHAGEADGRPYLAMRFVEGTDLAAMIADHGALHPRDATEIVGQIASALDAAHARGLVHRDVKPSNILVTRPAGRWHSYLTDFGITKDLGEPGMTGSGVAVGTLAYIAPEQLEGGPIDGRADVYALGCVLFHALTGVLPFRRNSMAALMYAHLHDPPPLLAGPLGPVLDRALAKRPADRYPSAVAFGRAAIDAVSAGAQERPDLRAEVVGRPVPDPPPGPQGTVAPPTLMDTVLPAPSVEQMPAPPGRIDVRTRRWVLAGGGLLLAVAAGIGLTRFVPEGAAGGADTSQASPGAPAPTNPAGRVGSEIPVGRGPVDIDHGEGLVWTANAGGGSISRVDPVSATSTEVYVGGQPNAVVVGRGTVWVWNYSRSLTPVDATTATVGNRIDGVFDFTAVAAGTDSVWYTSPDAGVVGQFDMASATFLDDVIAIDGRPSSISVDAGKVYVIDQENGTLVTIDEAGRTVLGEAVPLPAGITTVSAGDGQVYVGGPAGFARLGTAPLTPDQIVSWGGDVAGMVPGPDSAWLVDVAGNQLHRVALDDLRTPLSAPLQGVGAGFVDMDVVDGVLWFVNGVDSTVTRIDPGPL